MRLLRHDASGTLLALLVDHPAVEDLDTLHPKWNTAKAEATAERLDRGGYDLGFLHVKAVDSF